MPARVQAGAFARLCKCLCTCAGFACLHVCVHACACLLHACPCTHVCTSAFAHAHGGVTGSGCTWVAAPRWKSLPGASPARKVLGGSLSAMGGGGHGAPHQKKTLVPPVKLTLPVSHACPSQCHQACGGTDPGESPPTHTPSKPRIRNLKLPQNTPIVAPPGTASPPLNARLEAWDKPRRTWPSRGVQARGVGGGTKLSITPPAPRAAGLPWKITGGGVPHCSPPGLAPRRGDAKVGVEGAKPPLPPPVPWLCCKFDPPRRDPTSSFCFLGGGIPGPPGLSKGAPQTRTWGGVAAAFHEWTNSVHGGGGPGHPRSSLGSGPASAHLHRPRSCLPPPPRMHFVRGGFFF